MKLKEALNSTRYCGDKPIVKECAWCSNIMDEVSKTIIENRKMADYVISHGMCEDCYKKEFNK